MVLTHLSAPATDSFQMLTDYDEDLNEIHCYANVVCEPGDQVFICYSTRPNSDFLVHNGFVYPDNPNDTVQIKLGQHFVCDWLVS